MEKTNVIKSARILPVIETSTVQGDGTEKDPVRIVVQYWNLEGKLLAEHDTAKDDFIVVP